MPEDAVYTEMLQVSVDVPGFTSSLDEMVAAYKKKLEEMSNADINPADLGNVANFGALSKQIEVVEAQISTLTTTLTEAFSALGDVVKAKLNSAVRASATAVQTATTEAEDAAEESLQVHLRIYKEQWQAFQELQALEVKAREEALAKMSVAENNWYSRTVQNPGRLERLASNNPYGSDRQQIEAEAKSARDKEYQLGKAQFQADEEKAKRDQRQKLADEKAAESLRKKTEDTTYTVGRAQFQATEEAKRRTALEADFQQRKQRLAKITEAAIAEAEVHRNELSAKAHETYISQIEAQDRGATSLELSLWEEAAQKAATATETQSEYVTKLYELKRTLATDATADVISNLEKEVAATKAAATKLENAFKQVNRSATDLQTDRDKEQSQGVNTRSRLLQQKMKEEAAGAELQKRRASLAEVTETQITTAAVKGETLRLAAARAEGQQEEAVRRGATEVETAAWASTTETAQRAIELQGEYLKKLYTLKEALSNEATADVIRNLEREVSASKTAATEMESAFKTAQRAARSAAPKSEKPRGDFFSALIPENFSEFIGNVVRFQLAWGAVGAVMHGVEDIGHGIVDAFKSGWNYLENVQDAAAQLHVVLASNVEYSKDLATNFQLADQAAKLVADKFQDVGAKTGLDPKQLTQTFASFIDAGGASLVKNTQQQVDFVTNLSLAARTVSADSMDQRKILRDIPKLLDGTIDKSSSLLRIMGLTKDEWLKIRDTSLQHRDLLDQIHDRMEPMVQEGEELSKTTRNRTAAIKEMFSQMMGDFEKPIFKAWNDELDILQQKLKDTQQQHKETARSIGQDVATTFQTIYEFESLSSTLESRSAAGFYHGLGVDKVVKGIETGVGAGFKGVGTTYNTASLFWNGPAPTTTESGPKVPGNIAQLSLDTPVSGKGQHTYGEGTTKGPKFPGNAEVQKLLELYRQAVEITQQSEQEYRSTIKSAMTARAVSIAEGSKNITTSLKAEADQVKHLRDVYLDLIGKVKGANPDTVAKGELSVAGSAGKAISADNKGINTTNASAAQDAAAVALQTLKDKANLVVANQQATIQRMQDLASRGLASQKSVIEQKIALENLDYTQTTAIQAKELEQAGQNAKQKESVQAQMEQRLQRHINTMKSLQQQLAFAGLDKQMQASRDKSTEAQAAYKRTEAEVNYGLSKGASPEQQKQAQLLLADAAVKAINTQLEQAKIQLNLMTNAHATSDVLKTQTEVMNDLATSSLNAQAKLRGLQYQIDHQALDIFGGADATPLGNVLSSIFKHGKGTSIASLFQGVNESDGTPSGKFDLGHTAKTLGKMTQGIVGTFSAISQGMKENGIGGAIGAGFSQVGSMVGGPVGAVMQTVGGIISAISGMFTAAAKHIAESIATQFDLTMQKYQNGQTSLTQTLQQVEQERTDAINRLSGQKGGQDQLDKLLPEFDQAIAQLKQEQKQIIDNFERGAKEIQLVGTLGDTTLETFAQKWAQINDEVEKYTSAGGSLQTASQYLSESLKQLQQQAENSLNSGESTAIQDAKTLNNLIQQRTQLLQDEKQKEFGIQNADAIERNLAPAIRVGQQLNEARTKFNSQLTDLNNPIDLETQKVALEKQVYNIATDTASLNAQSNQLALQSLQQQVEQWKQLQQIVNGITEAGGQFQFTNDFGSIMTAIGNLNPQQFTPITNVGTININVNPPAGSNARDVANATVDAINGQRYRYGMTGYGPPNQFGG